MVTVKSAFGEGARDVEWGAFGPLKLRAKIVAEGLYAGQHRSTRKGPGVEFGGQRPYVFGDDLRFIDRRALLRHNRLMIREFETETDRALWLLVDATLSMSFRGAGKGSKYAYAALLAAALSRVASRGGDPVGLCILGGSNPAALPARAGREAFERLCYALESTKAAGDWSQRAGAVREALLPVYERAKRGSIVVWLSDFVDLPTDALRDAGGLSSRGRRLYGVRVLSPQEASLPFADHARFVTLEGNTSVEADPERAREGYLVRLADQERKWKSALVERGGDLLSVTTDDDPVAVVRSLLAMIAERQHDDHRSSQARPDEGNRLEIPGGSDDTTTRANPLQTSAEGGQPRTREHD